MLTKRLPVKSKVIFKNIIFNIGGGYNSSTGYFTAPVDGTYSFSVHICALSNYNLDVEIVVEGVSYATESLRNSGLLCGAVNTFAVLARGQKVWVQTLYPGNNVFYEEQNYFRDTFTGALVY